MLSSELIFSKPSPSNQPHWKTTTRLPYAAATDSTVISTPLSARNTDRIDTSSITNAIVATNRNTSGWVLETRSSKSLISAVGPPTSTRAFGPAACGSLSRIQSTDSRAARSSGSTDSTADSSALVLLSANAGGCTACTLGARVISWRTASIVAVPLAPSAVALREGHQHPHRAQRSGTQRVGGGVHPAADLVGRLELALHAVAQHHAERRCRQGRATGSSRQTAEAHGLRITAPVHRVQNRDCGRLGAAGPVQVRRALGRRLAERRQHGRGQRGGSQHRDRDGRGSRRWPSTPAPGC